MPVEMLEKYGAQKDPDNKVFAYSQKTRCLKLIQRLASEGDHDAVYQCFLDTAPMAWALYSQWKAHQGFVGTRLASIIRDGRKIIAVPDGIIFPIISGHSVFMRQDGSRWVMQKPPLLTDGELIEAAVEAYGEIAKSNPQTMGKTKACYSAITRMTRIFARLPK